MDELVSIIIPCFNAEKWLKEALDSCLNQTYQNIEIVIVDDGSTDNSLEIIKSYKEQFADKVVYESQPNSGSNPARNKGFSISKGKYILYMDADDYILPERIEKQVRCFQETGADVVFSSVRSQKHLANGTLVLGDPSDERYYVEGDDILECLITCRRFAHTLSPIFTRAVVEQNGGWDEAVKCSQDRDFLLTVAIRGAQFVFLPGCYSVYRQYENEKRVSAISLRKRADSSLMRLRKVETLLIEQNKFEQYRNALANAYFRNAILYATYCSPKTYFQMLKKVKSLNPDFQPDFSLLPSPAYQKLNQFLGFFTAGLFYKYLKNVVSQTKKVLGKQNSLNLLEKA